MQAAFTSASSSTEGRARQMHYRAFECLGFMFVGLRYAFPDYSFTETTVPQP